MKNTFLIYILLITTLLSCRNIPEHASEIAVKQEGGFLVYTGDFSNDLIGMKAIGYANQNSGAVLLEYHLLNKGEQPLTVKYILTELATLDGLRSSPEYLEDFPQVLASGEEAKYALKYLPTNSRHLYTEIGYRGDLEPQYEVDLEFLGLKGEKLSLKTKETIYNEYLKNFGQEGLVRIHQVSNQEEWLKNQVKCVEKVKGEPSSVNIHDQEILIQGVVCKMAVYHAKNQLHLRLRMSNQSNKLLNVIPENLWIEGQGKKLEIAEIEPISSNRKNPTGKGVVLRKSERYQANYVFNSHDEPIVHLKSIGGFFEENEQHPLLCYPLVFSVPEG